MRVSVHRAARLELVEATNYYQEVSAELAKRFGAQVTKALLDIGHAPFRWRTFDKEWRNYLVERFPYSVIYQIKLNCVRVLAIAHQSRSPYYWTHRH